MNNRDFGNKGEDLACQYLIEHGYKIIERNVHYSKYCEIDIIAKYKDMTVFVEVKTRKNSDYGSPFEAVTKTKYQNIKTGLFSYIKDNKIKNFRIDVIAITFLPDLKIEHMKNI